MSVATLDATLLPVVTFLGPALRFPRPETADGQGLIAVGGDLSLERLSLAYRSGIFPWPIDRMLTWFCPDPRAILELDGLHVSRSLAKRLRRPDYEVRVNTAFERVIRACAARTERRPSTWILPQLVRAYTAMHTAGQAHSVEVWMADELVGGLYGVSMGGLFAGESMFSTVTDASKIALVHLVERMRARGLTLLDVQVPNPHLETLGIRTIPRAEYLTRLEAALALDVRFADPPSESR
jgi:leucyl/phenylalanyl-tRNA---protein transferase